MNGRLRDFARLICAALCTAGAARAADHVDLTWLSIANMQFDVGGQHILADGYITRLPREVFYSGQSGYGRTQRAAKPDERAVREVLEAMGGRAAVNLLLTGHNHFDHS